MHDRRFSIVIPYKQRLDNLRLVLASLAEQTLDSSRFEVLIGAMEYSPEFVAVCREFTDRLALTAVLSAEEWNLCHARNLAIRCDAPCPVAVLLVLLAVGQRCA
jgi:hypothetical protein